MIWELLNNGSTKRRLEQGVDVLEHVRSCREIKGSNSSIFEVELKSIDAFLLHPSDQHFFDEQKSSAQSPLHFLKQKYILKELIGSHIREELQLVESIRSRNIVLAGLVYLINFAVYKTETLEVAYILMERGDMNLQEFVEQRIAEGQPLTQEEFLTIAEQTITALRELQHKKIAHNDIKPANILVIKRYRKIKQNKKDKLSVSSAVTTAVGALTNSPKRTPGRAGKNISIISSPSTNNTVSSQSGTATIDSIENSKPAKNKIFSSYYDYSDSPGGSTGRGSGTIPGSLSSSPGGNGNNGFEYDIIVKLCDIGSGQQDQSTEKFAEQRGTLSYMAPEIIINQQKERVNIYKQDVFSLGLCLVYVVLQKTNNYFKTERAPWKDFVTVQESQEIYRDVLDEWSKCIGTKMGFSKHIQFLLNKMLCFDGKNRPDFIELSQVFVEVSKSETAQLFPNQFEDANIIESIYLPEDKQTSATINQLEMQDSVSDRIDQFSIMERVFTATQKHFQEYSQPKPMKPFQQQPSLFSVAGGLADRRKYQKSNHKQGEEDKSAVGDVPAPPDLNYLGDLASSLVFNPMLVPSSIRESSSEMLESRVIPNNDPQPELQQSSAVPTIQVQSRFATNMANANNNNTSLMSGLKSPSSSRLNKKRAPSQMATAASSTNGNPTVIQKRSQTQVKSQTELSQSTAPFISSTEIESADTQQQLMQSKSQMIRPMFQHHQHQQKQQNTPQQNQITSNIFNSRFPSQQIQTPSGTMNSIQPPSSNSSILAEKKTQQLLGGTERKIPTGNGSHLGLGESPQLKMRTYKKGIASSPMLKLPQINSTNTNNNITNNSSSTNFNNSSVLMRAQKQRGSNPSSSSLLQSEVDLIKPIQQPQTPISQSKKQLSDGVASFQTQNQAINNNYSIQQSTTNTNTQKQSIFNRQVQQPQRNGIGGRRQQMISMSQMHSNQKNPPPNNNNLGSATTTAASTSSQVGQFKIHLTHTTRSLPSAISLLTPPLTSASQPISTFEKSSKSLMDQINEISERVYVSEYVEMQKFTDNFIKIANKHTKYLTLSISGNNYSKTHGLLDLLSRCEGLVFLNIIIAHQTRDVIDCVLSIIHKLGSHLEILTVVFKDCEYSTSDKTPAAADFEELSRMLMVNPQANNNQNGKNHHSNSLSSKQIISNLALFIAFEGRNAGHSGEILNDFMQRFNTHLKRVSALEIDLKKQITDAQNPLLTKIIPACLKDMPGLNSLAFDISYNQISSTMLNTLFNSIDSSLSCLETLALNLANNSVAFERTLAFNLPATLRCLYLNFNNYLMSSIEFVKLNKAIKALEKLETVHLYLSSCVKKNESSQLMLFLCDILQSVERVCVFMDSNHISNEEFNIYKSYLLEEFKVKELHLSLSKNYINLETFKILAEMIFRQKHLVTVGLSFPRSILKQSILDIFANAQNGNKYEVTLKNDDYDTIVMNIRISQKFQGRKSLLINTTKTMDDDSKSKCVNIECRDILQTGYWCLSCYNTYISASSEGLICKSCVKQCHFGHEVICIGASLAMQFVCRCKDRCIDCEADVQVEGTSLTNLSPVRQTVGGAGYFRM